MRTVGNHIPQNRPRGAYRAVCSCCGVVWWSYQLRKTPSGSWECPDVYRPGSDMVSLNRKVQARARSLNRRSPRGDGPPPAKREEYTE